MPEPIGEYTITPIPSRSANGSSFGSASRSISEYSGCSVSTGRDLLDALELADAEVGDADVAHEPLLAQLRQRGPPLLDVLGGIGQWIW